MPRGPKLPWMLVQSPGELLRVAAAQGDDLGALHPPRGKVVDHPHEADADDADADHFLTLRYAVLTSAATAPDPGRDPPDYPCEVRTCRPSRPVF